MHFDRRPMSSSIVSQGKKKKKEEEMYYNVSRFLAFIGIERAN